MDLGFHLKRLVPRALRDAAHRRVVRYAFERINFNFRPTSAIQSQQMAFVHGGRRFEVSSDYRTPLYETINEVVDYDCYQLQRCQFSTDGQGLIIDVGGNVGVTALVLAHGYAGRVVSLEPIPANHAALEKNLAANGVTNVDVLLAALGERDGEMELWMDPDQSVSAFAVAPGGTPWTGQVAHRAVSFSLASLLARYPGRRVDFLKMDCEGGEYAILDQINAENAASFPQISMEVHDRDARRNAAAVRARLEGLGYEVFHKPELLGRPTLHHFLARWRGQPAP